MINFIFLVCIGCTALLISLNSCKSKAIHSKNKARFCEQSATSSGSAGVTGSDPFKSVSSNSDKSQSKPSEQPKSPPQPEANSARGTDTKPEQLPVRFNIIDNITIPTNSYRAVVLNTEGDVTDYFIKSIYIYKKNTTTDCKALFGLDKAQMSKLKENPISYYEGKFFLQPSIGLKPDNYVLTINIGKIGLGSKSTQQSIYSTISVLESQDSPKTTHPTQGTSVSSDDDHNSSDDDHNSSDDDHNSSNGDHNSSNDDNIDVGHTVSPKFSLADNITLKCGVSEQVIRIKAEGETEGYYIQSMHISYIKEDGTFTSTNYKDKFGLSTAIINDLKKTAISPPNKEITLRIAQKMKLGKYQLTIKLNKRNEKGVRSRSTEQVISTHMTLYDGKK